MTGRLPTVADLDTLRASLDRGVESFVRSRPELDRVNESIASARRRIDELEQKRLTVGLLGGTGVGKSTLLNAIAGRTISRSGDRRPTTDRIVCYRHRDFAVPTWLSEDDVSTPPPPHEIDSLKGVILLDLPDIDSYEGAHRERVHRVLSHLDLLLVVTSVDKYADRILYEELGGLPQAPKNLTFVLNAIDRLSETDLELVESDFRDKLEGHGHAAPVPLHAVSALNALESPGAGRIEPLLERFEELGLPEARRRALEANAAASVEQLHDRWEEAFPSASLEAAFEQISAVPVVLPIDPALQPSVEHDIHGSIEKQLRDLALRGSWFPIGWLYFLWRLLPGRRRGPGPSAPPETLAASFAERALHAPLRIARRLAESRLRPIDAAFEWPLPVESDPSAPSAPSEDPLREWHARLIQRGTRAGWKIRHHLVPGAATASAILWITAPLWRDGTEWGPLDIVQRVADAATRLSPLQWVIVGVALLVYYALALTVLLHSVERRAEREASRGAGLLLERWQQEFRRQWGAPFESTRDSVTQWWRQTRAQVESITAPVKAAEDRRREAG